MAHISLYRRYRPSGFEGVIGQNHIVKVLRNQVKNSHVSHAYLFTGSRGTGKTSVAKIFAKAINCLNPIDGSPCNECKVCQAINESYDIIELDAASNNGADSIRDLQESVKYEPSIGTYKVFIIDEVHMLTTSAFNALLKTLEEPPRHVVFILATTEVHQLPATVLSRCLKFDFRLVASSIIADKIKEIYDDISFEYDESAVMQIAEAGDGSVRDALSIADMCLSFADKKLTYDDVLEVLGASDPNTVIDIMSAILEGSTGKAMSLVDDILKKGKSVNALARDLLKMFRNLYLSLKVNDPEKILTLPQECYAKLAMLGRYDSEVILNIIELFSGLDSKLKYASVPRVLVEAVVARASDMRANLDLGGLSVRVKTLEKQLDELKKNGISAPTIGGTSSAAVDKIQMTARGVLGQLLVELREQKELVLLESVKEIRESNIKINNSCLIFEIEDKAVYGMLTRYSDKIKSVIADKFIVDKIEIRVIGAMDINSDIAKVKALFSSDIIVVNN